jgi:hypothetical protein
LICETGLNALHINSNLPVAGDRVQSEAVGMSQVEMELARSEVTQEEGLSTWAAAKPQLSRLSTQVAAKDLPQ